MKSVNHNSCESEAGNDAIYLNQLQGEMSIGKPGVLLKGDNESSLNLVKKSVTIGAAGLVRAQVSRRAHSLANSPILT